MGDSFAAPTATVQLDKKQKPCSGCPETAITRPRSGWRRLQGAIGNQALQRIVQSKQGDGNTKDKFEQEADHVADRVVAGLPSAPRNRVSSSRPPASANGEVPAAISLLGAQLDPTVRRSMEGRFGYDFSTVRVHADARAAQSAASQNAQAYTVGRDIVFGAGRYVPGTLAGQRLIAHELTHVIQQTDSPAGPAESVIQRQNTCNPGDAVCQAPPEQNASQANQPGQANQPPRVPDDFDPCTVNVETLTNAEVIGYWTRADAYLKARQRGEDLYYDYAKLMRRLITERRHRVQMGHAWLGSANLTGMPDRLYEIIPGPGLTATIAIVDPASEMDTLNTLTSVIVTPEQFAKFLEDNNIPQLNVEDWYAQQALENPEALSITLPPPPTAQREGTPGSGPFTYVDLFGRPINDDSWLAAASMGIGASGLTASSFDMASRSAFLAPVYTPNTVMTNPQSVSGAELNWRGSLPELSMMRGSYADWIRYRNLNAVGPNFPVFDIATRGGNPQLISVTHSLPGPSGQVDMAHYAEKFRIMTGDYDPRGTNIMGQSLALLNQDLGTAWTVADVNLRNRLAVPDDHVTQVQDALEARIARSPIPYASLVDALLSTDPITLGGTTYQSWNQLQAARTNRTINHADYTSIRQQLGQRARSMVIGIGMTLPEITTLQDIRTSMQLRNFGLGQTSILATPEVLEVRRLMATGMPEGEAINAVAGRSGLYGAGMGTAVSVVGGAIQIIRSDESDPYRWQRAGVGVPLGAAGGYGQAYLETQLTTRMLNPLLTEATTAGGASASMLTAGGLASRGVGGLGAGAVVAPAVTWLSMAADEEFFGAYYTRIDYAAKGARSAVAGGVAAGGGALAAGLVGGAAGSEVPIVGNAVGFVVGIGLYYLTDWLVGEDIEQNVREAMGEMGCVGR